MNTPREMWEIPVRWVAPREDTTAFFAEYEVRPWAEPTGPRQLPDGQFVNWMGEIRSAGGRE
jgi:hypothetical protein